MDIDFQIIETLSGVPSKKYLKKILEYCFMIKNKIYSYEQFYQTPVALQFHKDLDLTEAQSHKLLINIVGLIEVAAQNNFEELESLFPENFSEELSGSLIDLLSNYGDKWIKTINQKICQADRLVDIDWRLDVQVATQDDVKKRQPVVYMQLDTINQQTNQAKNINFQMNSGEINSFYNNFKKIKEQLQLLSQKQ